MNQHFSRLSQLLKAHNLEAVALNPGPTLRYLTGLEFHLMERPVVAVFGSNGTISLVLPALESAKLADLDFSPKITTYGDDPAAWQAAFNQAFAEYDLANTRIGVEPARFRVLELNFLQKAVPNAQILDGGAALADLRVVKDAEALTKMRRAAVIAQQALLETLKTVRPGQTEKQIAAELMVQLFRAGSDPELPFAPIVATGPNTANPHATPSDRKLGEGEFLLIDWGAAYEGYFSDITRTFFCGEPTSEMRQVAELVKAANQAGREAGRAGMTAGQVDAAARETITRGGYGDYFTHRTGHGLGMETHETPYIFAGNPLVLGEGMVFTIEPGIYLPGKGGVRIEDDVVVRADRLESLTDLPRDVVALESFWS